jgi:hypothetical protein
LPRSYEEEFPSIAESLSAGQGEAVRGFDVPLNMAVCSFKHTATTSLFPFEDMANTMVKIK